MRVIVAHHWVLIPYQVICLIKKENIDLVYCFGKWGAINFDIWQLRISLPSEEKTWLVKASTSHQANLLFLRHHSLLYIYLFLLSALSPLLSACMFPAGSSPLSARLICLHVAQWQVALYGVAQWQVGMCCPCPLSPPLPPPIIPDFSMPKLFSLNTRAGAATVHQWNCVENSVQCKGSVPCTAFLSLECTDGPRHAIRPGAGTDTWSSSLNLHLYS